MSADARPPRPEVWLVRHGETAWNVEGRIQGHTDVPLSARGEEQAQRLADRLAGAPPARIVSSDLRRARDTAERVARRLRLPVTSEPDLREQNLGAWQGLTADGAKALDPELYGVRFVQRDPGARPPGGETRGEVQERVWRALDRHTSPGSAGPLLLVAHGGVVSTIVYRVLGLPLSARRPFALPNVGITSLSWRPDGWRLVTLNDVCHCPPSRDPTYPFDL